MLNSVKHDLLRRWYDDREHHTRLLHQLGPRRAGVNQCHRHQRLHDTHWIGRSCTSRSNQRPATFLGRAGVSTRWCRPVAHSFPHEYDVAFSNDALHGSANTKSDVVVSCWVYCKLFLDQKMVKRDLRYLCNRRQQTLSAIHCSDSRSLRLTVLKLFD